MSVLFAFVHLLENLIHFERSEVLSFAQCVDILIHLHKL